LLHLGNLFDQAAIEFLEKVETVRREFKFRRYRYRNLLYVYLGR